MDDLPLQIREDDFSWQGTVVNDRFFYIRRLKHEDHVFSDLNMGGVSVNKFARLLGEFIMRTGTPSKSPVVATNISTLSSNNSEIAGEFDAVCTAVTSALEANGVSVGRTRLEPVLGGYNAEISFIP